MLRKIAEIKVPKGAGPREAKTNPIFATYDRQGAAFAFFFSDSNIARATANLLFMVDGQKVFVDDGVTLGETNETHTFTYPLPDELLNYTGKIDGYLYFDFEDGSHLDEIHFAFTIKKSKIDEEMEEAPDVYIKSFEDIKAEVQEAADGAKETISQKVTEVSDTSDSAISKVNQVAKTADQAQGDIQTSVSDVQSRQAGAEKDIAGLVESTESARDEAAKTMNEIDYSNRNLLLDSGTPIKNDKYRIATYTLTEKLIEGETYTVTIKGKLAENKSWFGLFIGDPDNQTAWLEDKGGGYYKDTFKGRSEDIEKEKILIYAYPSRQTAESSIEWIQLNHGSLAAPWQPAAEDIVTQDQYNKLVNAITSLGGSI